MHASIESGLRERQNSGTAPSAKAKEAAPRINGMIAPRAQDLDGRAIAGVS